MGAIQKNPIPLTLSAGAASLVALADQIIVDERIPTCGTGTDESGSILLLLGRLFLEASDSEKSYMLEHEACHISLGHSDRFRALGTDADPGIWNQAADAALHHRCLDPKPFEGMLREFGGPVTFQKLELLPCTAEVAYLQLLEKKQSNEGGGNGNSPSGCGSFKLSEILGEEFKSLPEWAKAEIADAVLRSVGSLPSSRRPMSPICDPPPRWAQSLIQHLQRKSGRKIRGRSWIRSNRHNPFLPGRSRKKDLHALILLDCSLSIPDKFLLEVAALLSHMKYKLSVVLWAVEATGRLSVKEALQMLQDGTGPSGGTDASEAGRRRIEGERSIWITDGFVNWCRLSTDDIVLTNGEDGPAPSQSIRID